MHVLIFTQICVIYGHLDGSLGSAGDAESVHYTCMRRDLTRCAPMLLASWLRRISGPDVITTQMVFHLHGRMRHKSSEPRLLSLILCSMVRYAIDRISAFSVKIFSRLLFFFPASVVGGVPRHHPANSGDRRSLWQRGRTRTPYCCLQGERALSPA